MITKEINGFKVKFNNWKGQRVYVEGNFQSGSSRIGHLDISTGKFLIDPKGGLDRIRYNLDTTVEAITEMAKEVK